MGFVVMYVHDRNSFTMTTFVDDIVNMTMIARGDSKYSGDIFSSLRVMCSDFERDLDR